ncbi:antibiotic biosynthesis monooxygenase [Oleiagrimonas sp. C23AA]|uniref:antibiotic biosynthesis monooxygenase family protein n=1 Tax=Oleiagrimonas sp. C23AA TaxID=2719047 RepID=UPI001423E3CD|nr:antibiotic biosynthesis monooxygenase [Oleiagrimonas sp. C23AA]NII11897.1 hypothetical protein [Oleiagrimonas sp. C23AA]
MIARIWRGITRNDQAQAYFEHLQTAALPPLRRQRGLKQAFLLRREQGEQCEFQLITVWESDQAMRDWAGSDPERAVYSDQEDRYLLDMEPLVRLYEVADHLEGAAFGA